MRKRHWGHEGGQALLLFALALPLLFAMTSLVVDGSRLFVAKRSMQNAADAAALAAARELNADGTACAGPDTTIGTCAYNVRTTAAAYTSTNGGPAALYSCADASDTDCYLTPYGTTNANKKVELRVETEVSTFYGGVVSALGIGVGSILHPSARAVASVITDTSSTTTSNVWDAIYSENIPADTDNTCGIPAMKLNKIVIYAPFIAVGSVCLTGSSPASQILGAQVEIGDRLVVINSTNSIGVSGTPIQNAQIKNGCRVGTSGSFVACSAATHVYANTIGTNPTHLTRTHYDWAAEYTKAAPGPLHACDATLLNPGESAGTPPAFDNNATYSGAGSGTKVDITPAASYICRAKDADGVVGELSRNASQKKLTVMGVVFFDAILDITKSSTISSPIHYYGKGTIFFSSPAQSLFSGETWCSGGALGVDCAASPAQTNMPNWSPSANTLWLVFGDKCTGSCVNDINFPDGAFQGAMYGVHTCHVHGGGTLLAGPLVCGAINVDGSGPAAFTFPPVGQLEGGNTTSTSYTKLGVALDE